MSHESVIKGLRALGKAMVVAIEPKEHAAHLVNESDRSAIILQGSTIEQMLTHGLEDKLSGLNADETDRVFRADGPLGSFANKVSFALGLGIIDRATARKIDVIRAMRNAAAHCVSPIKLSDEPFRKAICQLVEPSIRSQVEALSAIQLRWYFDTMCLNIVSRTIDGQPITSDREQLEAVRQETSGAALGAQSTEEEFGGIGGGADPP